jgi:tyrosyl-tRNA synthetase
MPILEGTDGVQKMSKSLDNYIALTDVPQEIFGKVMSIPDELIPRYLQYAAFAPAEEVKQMEEGLKDGSVHPRNAKVDTAIRIVSKYHSEEAGKAAFEEFERIFKNKDIPDHIDEMELETEDGTMGLLDILAQTKLIPSKKEAKRMVEQGAVSIDSEKTDDPFATIELKEKKLFKVGKRKFLYVISK